MPGDDFSPFYFDVEYALVLTQSVPIKHASSLPMGGQSAVDGKSILTLSLAFNIKHSTIFGLSPLSWVRKS